MKKWTNEELVELAKKKINPETLKDANVIFHPKISTWRGSLDMDVQLLRSLNKGQIQNIVFRKVGDKHELIVGFRRYCHLKLLGRSWDEIKKDVHEKMSNREALIMAFSENEYRQNLSPIAQARAIRDFLKAKISIKEAAALLDKSQSWIRGRKALLELPEKVQEVFEKKNIDFGYSIPLKKLSGLEDAQLELLKRIAERGYGGINTIEKAEEAVTRTLAQVEHKKELVLKYGPCPKCGSKDIGDHEYWSKEQLTCGKCGHEWHKETKEPWEYYRLKQQAKELGLELELEGPGGAKLTPSEITEVLKRKEEEIAVEKKKALPDKFRCKLPLLELILPMIEGDNIQKLVVDDDRLEIQFIEGPGLQFKGLRKDYVAGEKCRIEVSSSYKIDLSVMVERVHAFIETRST